MQKVGLKGRAAELSKKMGARKREAGSGQDLSPMQRRGGCILTLPPQPKQNRGAGRTPLYGGRDAHRHMGAVCGYTQTRWCGQKGATAILYRKQEVQIASTKFNYPQLFGRGSASHSQFWVSIGVNWCPEPSIGYRDAVLTLRPAKPGSVNSR